MGSERAGAGGSLWLGVLVFRWAALAWMTVMALTSPPTIRPWIAWGALGAAAGWTAWLSTKSRRAEEPGSLALDLALAAALVLVSALVVPEGTVDDRQLFGTAYPIAAVLAWGLARGPIGGLSAGAAIGIAYVFTRPLNGIPLASLGADGIQQIVNSVANYLLAGGALGVVSRLLTRSEAEARRAEAEAARERERAARMSERESLARSLHDSVLQSLALISKRGREAASRDPVPGREVEELARVAAAQERELRALITREPAEPPKGMSSLRDTLEAEARGVAEPPVSVSATGPLWLPAGVASELTACVRQALRNVVEHAAASRATIYAEEADGWVTVTVRDDGRGFEFREESLREAGKAGILKSIKGRVEELGGSFRIDAGPGRGAEIELRAPSGGPR